MFNLYFKGFDSGFSHSSHPSHSAGGSGFGGGSSPSGTPFTGAPSQSGFSVPLSSGVFGGVNDAGSGNIGGNNQGGQFGSNQGQFSGSNNDDGSGNGDYSAIPGVAGADYPIYMEIPQTSFDCKSQPLPGYYADIEAQCQVFHICALNRTFDFLCPNGTIFSQESLVCVWWNQFDCQSAPNLYGNNAYIYDYSKTGQNSGNSGFQSSNSGAGFSGMTHAHFLESFTFCGE